MMRRLASSISGGVIPAAGSSSRSRRGPLGQRAGDLEPALLDQRELVGGHVALAGEPDQLQQVVGAADRLALPAATAARRLGDRREEAARGPAVRADHHVLDDGHLAEEPDVLERPRHAAGGHAIGPPARDVVALEHEAPGARRQHAGDQVEERRLAGAVRPDHRVDGAGLDDSVDVGHGGEPAERLRQSLDGEHAYAFAARADCRESGGRGRPISPHGRQIIMATSSVPKKVMRHSWITRSTSGSSVTATAPATAPQKLPMPPSSTMTKISAERWKPNCAESMKSA